VSYIGLSPSSEAASNAGRANRGTDTAHELLLRKELWRLGLRYRKHATHLPGKPDLAFASARVAVFCDGDFWHGRDWRRLRARLARRHNPEYWLAKIKRNRARDRENNALLARLGWAVLRLWESDIKRSPSSAAAVVRDAVLSRLPG
jgi:DNA mismatch endonuclease (patch repair protein)